MQDKGLIPIPKKRTPKTFDELMAEPSPLSPKLEKLRGISGTPEGLTQTENILLGKVASSFKRKVGGTIKNVDEQGIIKFIQENPKTFGLVNRQVRKSGLNGITQAFILAAISSFGISEWARLDNFRTATNLLQRDAAQSGNPEIIRKAQAIVREMTEPNFWDTASRFIPFVTTAVSFTKATRANIEMARITDDLMELDLAELAGVSVVDVFSIREAEKDAKFREIAKEDAAEFDRRRKLILEYELFLVDEWTRRKAEEREADRLYWEGVLKRQGKAARRRL